MAGPSSGPVRGGGDIRNRWQFVFSANRGMSGIEGSSCSWPVEGDVRNRWQLLGLASRGGCQESMAVPGVGQ